ncbi:glycosyltransferase family 2 protein [Sphingobium lignivorans]|uniref:Glycosyltransferase involved in cell wall biosynthesis n=1 Tax=Sphingobium lignivorans TaxID=2735886 RepID=A0ABR6NHB2_9SPHN|nr:glycosyltransferase family 2 protein [Sphingobium lignivorans]MBB5986032.1 glycosyltransferase involved in cell wall biosynthesis [Sphingobium lignivorans]
MVDAHLSGEPALPETLRVAVLLPCYNEATAIGHTVEQFARALPGAAIYVFDNNSSDESIAVAQAAGAIVRRVRQQGKGHVVRRMFADVDADIYVMADGDATYEAAAAPVLIAAMIEDNLDMMVGARRSEVEEAYRLGHRLGNRLLTGLLRQLFGRSFTDILSGYRVFSRRFVKSFPVLSAGFEIETEMSVHALELRMPVGEVVTAYAARPEGSQSKLSTFRDGWRILRTMIQLYRVERPLWFFGLIGLIFAVLGVVLGIPVVLTYLETGLVPRFPTVIAIVGLGIVAGLNLMTGLILDTVTRGRQEMKRLAYLAHPAPRL